MKKSKRFRRNSKTKPWDKHKSKKEKVTMENNRKKALLRRKKWKQEEEEEKRNKTNKKYEATGNETFAYLREKAA